jgi:hypothetical protein
LICNKANDSDLWTKLKPETTLTGVSYNNAGGWWGGERETLGFTVQNPNHWVYAGTNLKKGDVFGKEESLVGYECDGTKLAAQRDSKGNYVPSHTDLCPNTFQILGVGMLSSAWAGDGKERRGGDSAAATLGVWGGEAGKGTVFTAATTDWARVLAVGAATPARPAVERITRNVLDKLSSPRV